MAYLATGVQFALALRVSNLTEASRVVSFLILPFHRAFDPSLAYVAVSALPVGIILYMYLRGEERPRLGGKWSIPKGGKIDSKLLIGSSIFGVGWGLAGICRKLLIRGYHQSHVINFPFDTAGPGLVNFGRALTTGGLNTFTHYASWLGALIVGGLLG